MYRAIVTVLSLAYISTLSARPAFHTSPACWTEPRVHSELRDNDLELKIQRIDGAMPHGSVLSPNQAYAFVLEEQVESKSGTSTAKLKIYNERVYILSIFLPEMRGVGRVQWINEHLLFVRVWWGRIAGTDYIVDVEREEISNQQAFRYGAIAFQQFKNCETPDWSSSDGCRCYLGAPEGWKPLRPASDAVPNSR